MPELYCANNSPPEGSGSVRGGGGGNAREIKIKKTKKKGRKDADSDEESQATSTGLSFYFGHYLLILTCFCHLLFHVSGFPHYIGEGKWDIKEFENIVMLELCQWIRYLNEWTCHNNLVLKKEI